MAKEKPFHNPFHGLKLELPAEPSAKRPPLPAKKKSSGPIRAASDFIALPERPREVSEEEVFLRAVGEVRPVRGGANRVVPPPNEKILRRIVTDEEEVIAELCELVAGNTPFDLADSDEFIEGAISSLDRRILRRLRKGEYAIQGHLDLHGLTQLEAREALTTFVEGSRREGKRCVLVIHGKGLHSKDQLPVLKEGIQRWLTRGGLGGQILAFSSARPHDGGTGAVYVLLRR